jgi:hypothetical protein
MKDVDNISNTQPDTFEDIMGITEMQPDLLSENFGITGMKGPLLPHTGIDPIQELLSSVHSLTSVITKIEAKQEQ